MLKCLTAIASLVLAASTATGQQRPVLITEGSSQTVLLADSIDDDAFPIIRYTTVSNGTLRLRQVHEIDCALLRARRQIRERWFPWETAIDRVSVAAYKHVCYLQEPDRWTFMFSKDNGMYLVDRATTDTVPNQRKVRRVWLKAQNDTAVTQGSKKVTHEMTRYDFDCNGRRMRTLTDVSYDSAGAVVSRIEPGDSAKWSAIIPESMGESMGTWICTTLPTVDRLFPVKRR
jgi:hypothetical protein